MRFITTILVSLLMALDAAAQTIKVAAAVSLKESLTQAAAQFKSETGFSVEFVFGSSGQLAAQIQGGAPVDLFISAANKQVDDLVKLHLVDPATRTIIAMNSLVLIVPADASSSPVSIADFTSAGVSRIAIGEPKSVPAGQYAMQALQNAGIADKVKDKLIFGSNVRQVLDYVERGEVSAGLVYATDAMQAGKTVKVAATIAPDQHEPIVYPAIIVKAAENKDAAKRFVGFLTAAKGQAILHDAGFAPATQPSQ